MASQRKYMKNVLRKYSMFSNEELLTMIEDSLPKYIKLVKSEQIAIDILKSHNRPVWSGHENFKFCHSQMMMCADLRGISVPNHLYDVNITINDIIERIEEFEYRELKTIDEYNYKYEGYVGNGIFTSDELVGPYDGAEIMQMEVHASYTKIIDNVIETYSNELADSKNKRLRY